jgi:peptide/nickel transport system substrate-binding protein
MAPLAALTLTGLVVAGCGSNGGNTSGGNETSGKTQASSGQPKDGGTLTYAEFTDIINVNPIFIQDVPSQDAAYFLFASLYDYDRQGNLVVQPWSLAAQPLQISDDGKTYTIKLKDNAKWSDGQPVTADDVIYTIKTIMNPKVGSPGITNFDKIKSIKKIDDHTVQITLKQVYATFQYVLAQLQPVPYHVLKNVKPQDLQKNGFGTDPTKTVTDGPWKWAEWKQKQYLKFTRNPDYWGQKPHIDNIVCKIYADQNTETEALLKGDVDLVDGIPIPQLPAVQQHQGMTVLTQPGPQYEYMSFNFKASNFPGNFDPFTGVKTRQAIYYALNREGMVKDILKGTGRLINAPFFPGTWFDVNSSAVQYHYDPAKAKELLKEDGWKPGPDGILEKDGHKFEFDLTYNTGNARRQQVAAVIQQNLKAVGIQVNVKSMDFSSWIDKYVNPGKYQAVLLGWVLNYPDPDQESSFSSKYFPPNGQNMSWYKNPALDKLWVQGYSTTDQAKRKEIYAQIAKGISEDPPYVFLYQYGSPLGLGPRVHYKSADKPELSLPEGYFYHIENWWLG